MNKQVNYSEVPVGQKFEYKGKIYTRSTHCRGKQVVEGTQSFTLFKKHEPVIWIDALKDLRGE